MGTEMLLVSLRVRSASGMNWKISICVKDLELSFWVHIAGVPHQTNGRHTTGLWRGM